MRRPAAVLLLSLAAAPAAFGQSDPFSLELRAPAQVKHGKTAMLRGRIVPALGRAPVTVLRDGVPVGSASTALDGRFAIRVRVGGPGSYEARAGELVSNQVAPRVRPRLLTRVEGAGLVGRPLRLVARLSPAGAGTLRIEVRRDGRLTLAHTAGASASVRLPTRNVAAYRIRVTLVPTPGWAGARRLLTAAAVQPRLALGSRGPSVRALEQRLRELTYALPGADGLYGLETYQAVLAFQKVNGYAQTGRVDAALWRALARAHAPRARFGGSHIEISKGRQVLFIVRNGRVATTVHVSTGATGNTPIGTWRVYRKVAGWDWVLWYPMYFLRGFAIHGYPSVPSYPASHGCVRVPMWIAPHLWSTNPYGQTIRVYW